MKRNDLNEIIKTISQEYQYGKKLNTIEAILKNYTGNDWKILCKYGNKNNEQGYERILIHRCQEFEILLLCWQPGQNTQKHDHADNGCIVKILQGSLKETLYTKKGKYVMQLHSGDITYLDNTIGIHKVKNNTDSQAVSLHIYSPPDYKFNTF